MDLPSVSEEDRDQPYPQLNKPYAGQITPTRYIPKEGMTEEEWVDDGIRMIVVSESLHFNIGDWLVYGQDKYGESYSQAFSHLPYVPGTLYNDAYVSRNVPPHIRRTDMTWSHHQVVAPVGGEQDKVQWLAVAQDRGWSVHEFREHVRAANQGSTGPVRIEIERQLDDLMGVHIPENYRPAMRACLMTAFDEMPNALTRYEVSAEWGTVALEIRPPESSSSGDQEAL